jgi:hypothetical protein
VKARDAVVPVSLVVLAAGAAAYAYAVDNRTISDADRAARRGDAFPSFRVDQVTRVELDHEGESLVLERDEVAAPATGSRWVLTSPRRERANPAEVDALLRELELARRVREVPDGEAAGLASPRVRGRIQVGPIEYRFALGGAAPLPEGAAYMRLEGDKAFVVGRTLTVQLLRGSDAYRDRALVPYGANETARVDVTSLAGGTGFALERRGATFRVAGEALRASRTAVDQVFAALGDTRAETFLDDAAADRAMTGGSWRIALTPRTEDRPRLELRVGGDCPGGGEGVVVVRDAPSRVSACAPRTIALALGSLAGTLVDTAPFFARADEIEELRLESLGAGGTVVEVARKDAVWHERAPEVRDLDADETGSVNALVEALAAARALEARPATPNEHLASRARATIVRAGGGTSEVVDLGPPEADGSSWVRRHDDGAMLRVARSVARRFGPQPVALRRRSLWSARSAPEGATTAFDAAAVVSIDDSCGGTPQQLELRNRTWRMRSPAGFRADALSVADLTEAFAHAKADAWIADADDGTFGLTGPGSCEISFALDDGSSERRESVVFGAEGDGGVYAHLRGDEAIFVAPVSLREQAAHPAIDRARFRLDPATLQSVTLAREGRRLSFARAGGQLVPTAGDDRSATEPRTDDAENAAEGRGDTVEAAVAGLSAQVALHAGPPADDEGFSAPTLEILAATTADAGAPTETRIAIGAATRVNGADAYFARVAGVDATFAVPHRAVAALLAAW